MEVVTCLKAHSKPVHHSCRPHRHSCEGRNPVIQRVAFQATHYPTGCRNKHAPACRWPGSGMTNTFLIIIDRLPGGHPACNHPGPAPGADRVPAHQQFGPPGPAAETGGLGGPGVVVRRSRAFRQPAGAAAVFQERPGAHGRRLGRLVR